MDPISGISQTASGIKQLTKAGRELEGAINELNEFTNEGLAEQQRLRAEKARAERMKPLTSHQKALNRLVELKNIQEEQEKIKQQVVTRYGKSAYDEMQTLLAAIQKEEEFEKRAWDNDANKMRDLKIMAVSLGFLIAIILSSMGLL